MRRGVVHRDIKPSNLIVTSEGQLKVADFGIARVDTSNLTTAGMVIGTPSYMSPEQCRGLEADARSDLFSAGVVLYELLTGEKPFRGNLEAIAYKICHEEPEPPSKLSELKLPAAVDQLVATALAKEPAARFQDARAFHDALREVAQMSVEVDNGLGTTMVNIGTLLLQKPDRRRGTTTRCARPSRSSRARWDRWRELIVRKAAAQTNDRAELCSILSDNIVDPETRKRFVDAFNKTGSGVRGGSVGRARRDRPRRRRPRVASHTVMPGERARHHAHGRHGDAGRTARAGLRRSDLRPVGRLSRPDRADRDQEGGARGEDAQRFRAARGRQPRHAGPRGVPARSRVRRRLARSPKPTVRSARRPSFPRTWEPGAC